MHNVVINSFTFCVTDDYQLQKYITMETETATNMNICMYMYEDFIVRVCNMSLETIYIVCVCDHTYGT